MLGRLASLSPALKDKEIIFEKEAIVVQMVSDFDQLTPLKIKIEKNGLKN